MGRQAAYPTKMAIDIKKTLDSVRITAIVVSSSGLNKWIGESLTGWIADLAMTERSVG